MRICQEREGLRGRVPYVYVREPGRRSERQPDGGRGESGLPGPLAIDLEDTLLAMSWTYERDDGGVSELRLGSAGADGREVTKLTGEGWRNSVARYLTPAMSQARVFAGFQRSMAGGDGTRSLVSRLYRYSFASGNLARDAENRALPFALHGLQCHGRHVDAALPYTRMTCTRGDAEVTFRRS